MPIKINILKSAEDGSVYIKLSDIIQMIREIVDSDEKDGWNAIITLLEKLDKVFDSD